MDQKYQTYTVKHYLNQKQPKNVINKTVQNGRLERGHNVHPLVMVAFKQGKTCTTLLTFKITLIG